MNWIDLIISLLLVYAFYNGFKNGLILELTALLALVLGVFAAYYYADITAHYLDKWVDWSDAVLMTFAFILTFIIVVILINLIDHLKNYRNDRFRFNQQNSWWHFWFT